MAQSRPTYGQTEFRGVQTRITRTAAGKFGRPKMPVHGEGLRVMMYRVPGLTSRGLLMTPFVFQLPPTETLQRAGEFAHNDYDTIRNGQYSRPSGRRLKTIQFDTLFVDYSASWTLVKGRRWQEKVQQDRFRGLNGESPSPWFTDPDDPPEQWRPNPVMLSRELEHIMDSGSPFRLKIGQHHLWGPGVWDVNMLATLRTLTVEEKAGEVDARYVNVAFTEYRTSAVARKEYGIELPVVGEVDKDGVWRVIDDDQPEVLGLDKPVTLYSLSSHYYGTSTFWRDLARGSGITNWPGGKSLGEWVTKRNKKIRKRIRIPKVVASKVRVRHDESEVGLGNALIEESNIFADDNPVSGIPNVIGSR